MSNNTEHCCLSCGTTIATKRKDAKYCSDRCRMRYKRKQLHNKLLEQLMDLFTQLPNHYVHRTPDTLLLGGYDATGVTHQTWGGKDLEKMSNAKLKALIKAKKGQLTAEHVKQWWSNKHV